MFTILIQEKGGEQRRMVFNKPEVTIGRVQGNDIVLPKGNVSKRHARIVLKDGKFIIVDLKSTNGTYVNGRKITSPLVVKDSDKIYIGDFVLRIPIVQGELDHAHLCRLVGTLEIPAGGVTSTIPAGAAVEVTLDLDRGGHLSARALLPATSQVFEQVAHLLVPEADPDVLEASAAAMRDRLSGLRADAFRRGAVQESEITSSAPRYAAPHRADSGRDWRRGRPSGGRRCPR